jgi:predicted nucleic acid-binding protein
VSQFLFLDSGPLGLLTHPQRSAEVVAVTEWLARCLVSGSRVIVPAIVYYELKRELLRARRSLGVSRLDAFVGAAPGRYLPLSDEALRLAADLWARSRQEGQPTADAKALDVDVILGAQALSFGAPASDIIVVTMNAKLQVFAVSDEESTLSLSFSPRRSGKRSSLS